MGRRLRLAAAWPAFALVCALSSAAFGQGAPPADEASPKPAAKDEETEGVDPEKRKRAKELANEGMGLIKAGRVDEGVSKLREALLLVPVPTLALATARAMVGAGRLVAAVDAYRMTVDMKRPGWLKGLSRIKQEHAQRTASDELAALMARIPKVRLKVVGLEAKAVLIDGVVRDPADLDKEILLDPGIHVFEARAGEAVARKELKLDEGQAISVALQLDDSAPDPEPAVGSELPVGPEPDRDDDTDFMIVGAYAAFGLTAAALAATIGTWVTARGIADDIEVSCPDDSCDPTLLGSEGQDDLDQYQTLRTTTIAMGVVTGVCAAAGVTLFILAPTSPLAGNSSASQDSVSLRVGPTHLGVHGTF